MVRYTINMINEIFEMKNCKLISTEYICNNRLDFICPNGHQCSLRLNDWLHSVHKCKICATKFATDKQRLTFDSVKSLFATEEYILLSEKYYNNKENLSVLCPNKHNWNVCVDKFKNQGNRCPECQGIKKLTYQQIQKIFTDEEYTLLTLEIDYKNTASKVIFICPQKHTHNIVVRDFIQGNRCGICKNSKGEEKVRITLNKLKCNFIQEKKFDDCKIKKHLPFDFFVNDQFLIEYDGEIHFKAVDYYKGSIGLAKRHKSDKIKTNYCKQNNIPLLRIAYCDFNKIEYLIKDFINKVKLWDKKDPLIELSCSDIYNYLDEDQ